MTEGKGFAPRSFASSTEVEEIEEAEEAQSFDWRAVGTKAWAVAGVGAVLAGVGLSGLFGSGEPSVSAGDEKEILALQSQVAAAKDERSSLPDAKTGERDLVKALEAANAVADAQNGSRMLAKAVKDGKLDPAATAEISAAMRPLLDPSSDADVLGPWYLLASDAKVPTGIGIPETFGSGLEWQAQVPTLVGADGTVDVTWLAVQTRTAEDREPEVLAWAEGTYDTTRQVFTGVSVGTTTTGQALEAEVTQ